MVACSFVPRSHQYRARREFNSLESCNRLTDKEDFDGPVYFEHHQPGGQKGEGIHTRAVSPCAVNALYLTHHFKRRTPGGRSRWSRILRTEFNASGTDGPFFSSLRGLVVLSDWRCGRVEDRQRRSDCFERADHRAYRHQRRSGLCSKPMRRPYQ